MKLSKIIKGLRVAILVLLLVIIVLALNGCSIVPGAHISFPDYSDKSQYSDEKINFIPINSNLIRKSKSYKSGQVSQVNLQLEKLLENYEYHVGVGDVLNITVWDHPELTIPAGQFRSAGETGNVVHSDGTIFYPYIGKLTVSGFNVGQIRDSIAKGLAKYIEAPQIDVSVAAYHSQRVFVSGAVGLPTALPINNVPLTVIDALNACGGIAEDADWESVVLTSNNEGTVSKEVLNLRALYQHGDMKQNRLLTANDVLHVPRNDGLKVFVMGDVVKAGTQTMNRNGLNLAEALNNAGGINESTATASGIFVLRDSKSKGKAIDVFQLDASMGPMLFLSTQFQLKPMDMVYVTTAPVARWNKLLGQLLPTITGIYQLDRLDSN